MHRPVPGRFPCGYDPVLEALPIGIYFLEGDRLRYVNPWLSEALGYGNCEELIGKSFPEIIHPDDRERIKLEIQGQTARTDRMKSGAACSKRMDPPSGCA